MEAYQELERDWVKWAGSPHTVACSSGTAALHLALEAMQLPQGSHVLVPNYAMVACARAVALAGLVPILIDCKEDLNIHEGYIEDALDSQGSNGPKEITAVIAVHNYGRLCNMRVIAELAVKYDVKVIEDMAECHGIEPHLDTDVACWSFYKNKVIAGEEGGMCVFGDEEHAVRARLLRSIGFTPDQDYTHIPFGHNYRLANCLAELILENMRDYPMNIGIRDAIVDCYNSVCPTQWRTPKREVPWVYDLRIPGLSSTKQNAIVRALRAKHIQARHGFKPIQSQEEFRKCSYFYRGKETSESPTKSLSNVVSKEVIYLPIHPHTHVSRGIEKTTKDMVIEAFKTICTIA